MNDDGATRKAPDARITMLWIRLREIIFSKVRFLRKLRVRFRNRSAQGDSLTVTQWLYLKASDLSGKAREKFLDGLRRDSESEYRYILALLECDESIDIFPPSESLQPLLKAEDTLGRYTILEFIARGGMGEVYKASHPELGVRVLKILSRELAENTAFTARLRLEAKSANALNHRNIVTIHDCDRQGHLQFIVMEFVEGQSLRRMIGQLSVDESVNYAKQMTDALSFAHSKGIIHRDIKPENIMVRPDGVVKILDFGLAKPIQLGAEDPTKSAEGFDSTGINSDPHFQMGTLQYMAPEQLDHKGASAQSDIWSWGVVFYEMLTGRRPFDASVSDEIKKAIREKEPGPASPQKRLNSVIQKALQKDPGSRYRMMSDALDHLERATRPRELLRWSLVLALAISAGIIVVALLVPPPLPIFQPTDRLTTNGEVGHIALSPDGSYFAYSTQQRGGQSLRVRKRGATVETEIGRISTTGSYQGITYSKDGKFLYYVIRDRQGGQLFKVPSQGGVPPIPVANQVDSAISFSPDGASFVFERVGRQNQYSLVVRNVKDGHEETVSQLEPQYNLFAPGWSPDGKYIFCGVLVDSESIGPTIKILSVQLNSGRTELTTPEPWYWVGRPEWLAGKARVIVPVTTIYSNHKQLAWVSRQDGEYKVATQDPSDYEEFDTSADSKTRIALISDRSSSIWIKPSSPLRAAYKVPGTTGRYFGVFWTHSGRLISQTDFEGKPNLLSIDPETGEQQQLTHDEFVEQDPVSDGRHLVYSSNRTGRFHVWRADPGGKNAVALTSGSRDLEPTLNPAGDWIVYTSSYHNSRYLRKVKVEGGVADYLSIRASRRATFSPNGNFIVASYNPPGRSDWTTAILSFPSGELQGKTFDDIPANDNDPPVRWSENGQSLLYVLTSPDGVSNIWKKSIHGGNPLQLTQFTEDRIFAFSLGPDGRSLACIRGHRTSDVFLVQPTSK